MLTTDWAWRSVWCRRQPKSELKTCEYALGVLVMVGAYNQRTFRLGLIATEAAPVQALAATVFAFNAACLQLIFAYSLYVRLTDRP